jgi:hypothetical protein
VICEARDRDLTKGVSVLGKLVEYRGTCGCVREVQRAVVDLGKDQDQAGWKAELS